MVYPRKPVPDLGGESLSGESADTRRNRNDKILVGGTIMRKIISILLALTSALLLFSGCAAPKQVVTRDNDIVTISFDYAKQKGYATNQFAVWVEDESGKLVKTLFVTEFTAKGGYEKRADAIPTWVDRANLSTRAEADAVSGATPKSGALRYVWDLTDENGVRVLEGTYTFVVEGTLRWKNQVLYSGTITLNGAATTAEGSAEYTFAASDDAPALTPESPESGMISNVLAAYIPPKQS